MRRVRTIGMLAVLGALLTVVLGATAAAAIRLCSAFIAHLPSGRVPNRLDLPALSSCCQE